MLLGREAERSAIERLLADARVCTSGVLVVSGEAGIGKSALLAHAVAHAGDMLVLTARGTEGEASIPFAGLLELLRPVAKRAGELPGVQTRALEAALGGSGDVDRFAVYAATLGLVALVAEDGPVLCVMDDAQWVDPASSDALLFTARRLADGVTPPPRRRRPAKGARDSTAWPERGEAAPRPADTALLTQPDDMA